MPSRHAQILYPYLYLLHASAVTALLNQSMRMIIIIILVIIFMHGIYSYMPQTNHVSKVYSVTAVLYLQFALQVMLFRQ
jgi:hypothetical protein